MELVRQILKAAKVLKSMKITVTSYLGLKLKLLIRKNWGSFKGALRIVKLHLKKDVSHDEARSSWILHVTCFALISLCYSFAAFAVSEFIPMVHCKMLEDLTFICHLLQLW
ncbi:hypothetical protein SO802_004503 [Lithocarpus litseifolius]|uniref:Uncharacterized protein n=1 Tax=Lithocarpus litseifolius TaxID=425828 RepID=A0AAW2E4W7_9ROSI